MRNGGCLPTALDRRVHLHFESAPFVVQSICNTSDHISFRYFEVYVVITLARVPDS